MGGGRQPVWISDFGKGYPREEAMVEEAPLEDEVYQGVERVPYKQEAMASGRLLVERL